MGRAFLVYKVANYGKSIWLKDLTSGEVKGRYHVTDIKHYLIRAEPESQSKGRKSVADVNTNNKKDVREWMKRQEGVVEAIGSIFKPVFRCSIVLILQFHCLKSLAEGPFCCFQLFELNCRVLFIQPRLRSRVEAKASCCQFKGQQGRASSQSLIHLHSL